MNKIKLGVAGCGIAAKRFHWPAIDSLDGKYEVIGVTNRSRDKAVNFAELVGGAEIFDSYEDMLKLEELDAVDLALPIKLNPGFIEKAIKHNLDVICEKPIAPNVRQGKRVVEVKRQTDKVIYIAENFRHREKFKRAKKIIEKRKIGQPRFAIRQDWQGMTTKNDFVQTSWREDPDHIGGFLSDGGVHHVASLRQVLGEIEMVSGFTGKMSNLPGSHDSIELSLQFQNGTLGNYFASYGVEGESRFEIHGDQGRLKIENQSIKIVTEKGSEVSQFEPSEGFKNEFLDFYEVIMNGKGNDLGDPIEALSDLAVIQAGIISSENHRQVKVDEIIKDA